MTDRYDKYTERAQRVLRLAEQEAHRFNHPYIGSEHIVLGLVREGDGVAAKVLANLGVELNKVRSAIEFIIGRMDQKVLHEIGLTPRAKKIIELAEDEARRLGHSHIGTEHILLGLVREGEGVAAGVLKDLGVNLERVRAETIHVIEQESDDQVGFVNDFLAIEEADRQQRILEDFVSLRPSELTDEQVEEFEPTIRMWAMSLDQRKNAKSGGYTPPEA